jgi:calpain, invertebrate
MVRLVRCRNPWGNEVEWNGAWSDNDRVWNDLPPQDRQNLGQYSKADGEFWMTYEDWINNFEQIQICNLSPDTLACTRGGQGVKWNCLQFDGEWIIGKSAGGCGSGYNKQKFWTNPQYLVSLPQSTNGQSDCVLIVACMQKYTRQKRMQTGGDSAEEFIQLRVYRVNDGVDLSVFQSGTGQKLYPAQLERVGTSGAYINKREVTYQCRIPPGNYIVIPSTYDADKEQKFLLRIFTEGPADSISMNIDKPDVGPQEMEFHDGKGPQEDFGIEKWWENLPPAEKEKVKKMLGIAAVGGVALCCCIQLISHYMEQQQENENHQQNY